MKKEIKDFSKFVTDFGKAMKYISVSGDKEKYDRIVNEEPYNEVKMETARLLNECVGMKIPIEEGVESVKVCKAVQGIQEDAREEGKLEAVKVMITALQELGHTKEVIVKIIMDKFMMSEKDVLKYIK